LASVTKMQRLAQLLIDSH